ncbi:uncharacterized protein MKK02DRAFT_43517 [Dioszegia hungarica]|uniref:Uncharacterized protein n=1 Tax=Dioszegia hungarica TaxID=4972 RepID=A0AA38LXP7_9TREE|nr:uncharacterized protein MKK02DRAFT_43517 [Dioszegia hungarica]KAI9637591.1 hypothetical protein MKK02DRAFT_43517 [Dioszegia hungarica]
MPNSAKEEGIAGYNGIEIWVQAGSEKLDEKESRFDPAKKENRNPLFVPLGVDLSIHIAVRNKTMPHDLAFEISFDGRLVYTFFVKHGNHGTRRISHFFSEIGGYVHKVPFHASRIEASTSPTMQQLPTEASEIRIDVYVAPLDKGSARPIAPATLPKITVPAHELVSGPCCISASPAQPCRNVDRKTTYGPRTPYKVGRAKPWISFIYECFYQMDHTGGEDSKEKIAAVLAKRALDGPGVEHYESQVESLKHEISSLKTTVDRLETQSLAA